MLTEDFLKGRRRRQLSAQDVEALEALLSPPRDVPARSLMIPAGKPVTVSTLLIEGYIIRYMDDQEGGRQIVGLQVPGDFVDLHGYPLRRLDHNVGTLSACKIATVPHSALDELVADRPHLGKMLWFSTLLDAAMHREWIFRLGRLSAMGRIAHIICELGARLRAIDRVRDDRFAFPAIQADLAEMCGITGVHVNRVLRTLRNEGLMTFQSGQVEIQNRKGLERVAEFDPGYLFLEELG